MKKFQLIVFLMFSLLFSVAYASSDNAFNHPVPVQSFQTAGSPSPSAQAAASSNSEAMEKVKSIMRKSKQAVDSGETSTISNADAVPKIDKVSNKAPVKTAAVNELESQMSELNQAALLYQQNTDQKIETLTSQNAVLQTKVAKLTQAMLMLNQELSQLTPRGPSAASQMTKPVSQDAEPTWSQKIQARLHGATIYFAFAVVVLLAFLMAMLLRQNKGEDKTHDEYDFMNTHEAIPAKLDLARTYIDMGDQSAARKVLDDVIQKGDQAQKKTASELLKKLNNT